MPAQGSGSSDAPEHKVAGSAQLTCGAQLTRQQRGAVASKQSVNLRAAFAQHTSTRKTPGLTGQEGRRAVATACP